MNDRLIDKAALQRRTKGNTSKAQESTRTSDDEGYHDHSGPVCNWAPDVAKLLEILQAQPAGSTWRPNGVSFGKGSISIYDKDGKNVADIYNFL